MLNLDQKPLIKWPGGKSGLLPFLEEMWKDLPFDRYLDPFLGGGVIPLSFYKHKRLLVSDMCGELVHMYQTIAKNVHAVMDKLDDMEKAYNREPERYYYSVRSVIPWEPAERAARVIFLSKTGFNGLYREGPGGNNVPWGHKEVCPKLYDFERMIAARDKLQTAIIEHCDFSQTINEAREGCLVYCDPPYHGGFVSYVQQGFSETDHRRLADCCRRAASRGAYVFVSHSQHPLIAELYEGAIFHNVEMRRNINRDGTKRGPVPEWVIEVRHG